LVGESSSRRKSNFWLQGILLSENCASQRDDVLAATNDAGLMTRPAWTLMPRLPPFLNCPKMPLPVAESVERRLINLPSSPSLARPDAP
jgi:perosamine synthetase